MFVFRGNLLIHGRNGTRSFVFVYHCLFNVVVKHVGPEIVVRELDYVVTFWSLHRKSKLQLFVFRGNLVNSWQKCDSFVCLLNAIVSLI